MDDPVLSELHCTEDSNGTMVYYTILEEVSDATEESNILNIDNQGILGDNVFYLSYENNSEELTVIKDDDAETCAENIHFEEIMLPDGTRAYLKSELEVADEEEDDNNHMLDESNTLLLGNFVSTSKETEIIEGNNSEDEIETGEVQELSMTDDIEHIGTLLTAADEDLINQPEDEQVELHVVGDLHDCDKVQLRVGDGSVAIMDSKVYQTLLVQNQKKNQPPKEVNKAYDCPHENCNKAYTTMHHLRVHMRNHTGNRPYRCDVTGCEKAFSTGYSLKAHSRTHTGEKPYGCKTCTKSFKTSGDLQKHIRIHTGEKPFLCPIEGCGRSFTTSNIRKVHIRSHTGERPYECTVVGCDRAFASATNFKNHMRIHSGEKPYLCTVQGCGKRFTEYSSLYKHNLVHTNYKPCKCQYCGRTFRQSSTLIAHKRSVHNIFITENGAEIMLNLTDSNDFVLTESEENQETETKIVFVSQ